MAFTDASRLPITPDKHSPFVNEYGYLQTSQVFFLLWASHVVRLVWTKSATWSGDNVGRLTNPGECNELSLNICMDRIEVGLALLVRCKYDMYLGVALRMCKH